MTAIAADDRLSFDRLVAGKVGSGDDSTGALHLFDDQAGCFTCIESWSPITGDPLERCSKVGLPEASARGRSNPTGSVDRGAGGELLELAEPAGDIRGKLRVHGESFGGQT